MGRTHRVDRPIGTQQDPLEKSVVSGPVYGRINRPELVPTANRDSPASGCDC
jgi:hypothetical protein